MGDDGAAGRRADSRTGNGYNAIRSGLTGTSDDLGKKGHDPTYGQGRVNAARAAGM